MKKSGFTLIELIFVILIIGVLSAVAVPKFKNLKQNADASNVLKVGKDAFTTIPSSYVNLVDMEELYDDTNIVLSNLVSIDGKNWTVTDSAGANGQTAVYADNAAGDAIVTVTFNPDDRNVTLDVDCSKFKDSTTQSKCTTNNGAATSSKTLSY